ncbi:hypothetical protein A4X09_0g286 [Tilletia walkeri]|uniref:Protein OS-9 homolog n=1 Tax=Tilletia walkeri TaxID=117179 RepID=A0A8X7T855_9BASI|nr:hypothetical protein A4X09_0g286 [Tilletia walkeri]
MLISSPLLLLLLGLTAGPVAHSVKVIRPAQTSDQRFPPDAFAHPAFQVAWLDREPLRNATTHALLFGGGGPHQAVDGDELTLVKHNAAGDDHKRQQGQAQGENGSGTSSSGSKIFSALGAPLSRPLSSVSHSLELHFLDQDSPYLCAIPRINSTADKYRSPPESQPASAIEVLQQALALLEPLKPSSESQSKASDANNPTTFASHCLYYSLQWFTYSYCHGRAITQFHALPVTVGAAELVGTSSDSATGKALIKRIEPRKDPQWPAYVLGRWSSDVERLLDDGGTRLYVPSSASASAQHQSDLVSKSSDTPGSAPSSSTTQHTTQLAVMPVSSVDTDRAHIHTALIEVVAFDDPAVQDVAAEKDKDGARFRRAAEAAAKAAAGRGASRSDSASSDVTVPPSTRQTHSARPPAIAQRYISQTWSDGTPCVDIGEPREIEVQYHCVPSSSPHPVDRISMIRETTVCKYVIVIETSRLCSIPALAVGRRSVTSHGGADDAYTIDCRPIVRDDWDGEAAVRELEADKRRREEEEMAALRKQIQAKGLQFKTPSSVHEASSFPSAAAAAAGTKDDLPKAEKRKQAEDRMSKALSEALAEYFGLDPAQTEQFLTPRDKPVGAGTEAGGNKDAGRVGSHEEYFDADEGVGAGKERSGKVAKGNEKRLTELDERLSRMLKDLGVEVEVQEVQVVKKGKGGIESETVITRTATVSGPSSHTATAGAKEAAETSGEGASTESGAVGTTSGDGRVAKAGEREVVNAGDLTEEEMVDALIDGLGLSDWMDGALGELAEAEAARDAEAAAAAAAESASASSSSGSQHPSSSDEDEPRRRENIRNDAQPAPQVHDEF